MWLFPSPKLTNALKVLYFLFIYQTAQLELHRESITYVRRSLTSKMVPHQILLENSFCPRHLAPSPRTPTQERQLSVSTGKAILNIVGRTITRDSLRQPSKEGQVKIARAHHSSGQPQPGLLQNYYPASSEPVAAAGCLCSETNLQNLSRSRKTSKRQ